MRVRSPSGKSYFSKRRKRFDEGRCPRSLTFSCYHRFQFLAKDRTRQWFVEALQQAREKYPVDLWAWVIMPEHVHLLVCPRVDGRDVSSFVARVKEKTARTAIAWLKANASEWLPKITVVEGKRTRHRFWQPGGGYDRNLDSAKTVRATIDYLHANPVRRGLVERTTDWEWSSARWYAGDDAVIEMDNSLPDIGEQ
ncbi:MAG: transposase [Planctomycetaceae bacterium]|nr:transposase [Planctomycetaceae bacterium]MCB9952434.1 transposase [Planctomycetaceae bacterium]